MQREKIKFDDQWYFHRGDIVIPYAVKAGSTGGYTDCEKPERGHWLEIAYSDEYSEAEMDPKAWQLVDLPHDWAIEGSYNRFHKKGRAHLPIGIGCYRKMFTIPASDEGRKITIQFDGIMRNSTVWVNGHLIGTHASGYTSFTYDITDVVRYGDEGRNVIFIRVDASEYEGWWYDGCGIYRHVWMIKTDRLHVKQWGTYITTPEVSKDRAKVRLETTVVNEHQEELRYALHTEIRREDQVIAVASAEELIGQDETATVLQEIVIKQPELWHPDHPHLYRAVTYLEYNGTTVDIDETTFGIRTIEFTSDRGFFLNGEPLLIKGVCVHQDFAGVGSALPDRVNEYKIELLKEMGVNAYRAAHHPPTPELLDACDRLGIMVMDENRKLDSSPEGLRNLELLMLRDRNHPSIILWSMENEEVLEGTPTGRRILDTMARRARKLDPTRPVLAAMNHSHNKAGYADVIDVVGYNYGQYDNNRDVRDHEAHPDRIILGSESASYTTTRGIYADDDDKGYCSEYGTNIAAWCCSVEKAWGDVMAHRFLTGVFLWTGFDYKGEPTPYNWPTIGSHFGIMDSCGFPKHVYYYTKAMWREEPLVHLFPHWNWEGREDGEPIDVWVYSNCETVELVLNGRSLGEKPMVPYGHLEWKVDYEPGVIMAIGRTGGVEATRHEVQTVGVAREVHLDPDRSEIRADGSDVTMIRVSVRDAEGRVVPMADDEVHFTVEGSGKLIGVGNGDPSSHESDKASFRRVFNGYALAIVQSIGEEGPITIRATARGLASTVVTVDARR